MTDALTGDGTKSITVTQTQKEASWTSGITFATDFQVGDPTAKTGSWTVTYDSTDSTHPVKAAYTAG